MANHPLPAYHFLVEWGGTQVGFTEVSGLDIEVEVIEFREGNEPTYNKHKQPGLTKYSNITLKRGVTGNPEFFNWIKDSIDNNPGKRDVTISLLDAAHQPVVTWKIRNAFPVKYSGPTLNADSTEVAIESLELAHEGLTLVS